PAALQRRKLFAKVDERPIAQSPIFGTWQETWEAVSRRIGQEKHILIIDELPYAAESDPAMLSSLQHAWDGLFQNSNTIIVVCGSQVRTMESLQKRQSPLFGRFTGQWHLQPLPFHTLIEFFPNWSIAERVALYGILGGIPAYLEWLDPDLNLVENLNQVILDSGSMFLSEPTLLLYEEVRDPQSYLAVLKAIGAGCHTPTDISNHSLIGKSHLASYLNRLRELRFVERRLPATIPTAKRRTSRRGRYHLQDPYFRFYFRFMAPFHEDLPFDSMPVLTKVRQELRAFIGQTTFEELSRHWVQIQARNGALPFVPERIGSHWDRGAQVDVVAINWHEHRILLGECKWGDKLVGKGVIDELILKKTPRVLKTLPNNGEGWQVEYAFFARVGFTVSAKTTAKDIGAYLVDLDALNRVM
ncbi:MAG: ATP-binding protein, partial [Chloroflexota bacterium]